ncbi:MAG: hypothetical protein AAFQ38_14935 [Pseudomonadota bacterium]
MIVDTNTTQLPVITSTPLMDPNAFSHMQRVAQILALSPLFPEHLRKGTKEAAIANGVLVMNMAMRLNEDPLTVAQNIYFVGGKPGWSASYMISKANQHGVFKDPIDWAVKGKGTDNLSVTAFAILSSTGKKVEVTCDMKMAEAEGWTKNAKYKSMPEQMLRYRSATFLIRLYCPEVMVGVPATIELEAGAMKDVTPAEQADIIQSEATERQSADIEDSDDAPESEAEDKHDQEEKPEEKEADQTSVDAAPEHQKLHDQIMSDMADGMPADAVQQFYTEPLEKVKSENPEFHQVIMNAVQGAAKGDAS